MSRIINYKEVDQFISIQLKGTGLLTTFEMPTVNEPSAPFGPGFPATCLMR
jgi:hypothetical protein